MNTWEFDNIVNEQICFGDKKSINQYTTIHSHRSSN